MTTMLEREAWLKRVGSLVEHVIPSPFFKGRKAPLVYKRVKDINDAVWFSYIVIPPPTLERRYPYGKSAGLIGLG